MNMKPPLPLPGVSIDVATAGSALTTLTSDRMEKFMKGNEASCGPCTPPMIDAGVLLREKALGNSAR